MPSRTLTSGVVASALLVLSTSALGPAQEKYPSRPIDFIVPWGTGGGADSMARQLATLSQPALGVALPISNVPGASGNTGLAQVLAGKPDGYTIAVYIADTLATIPTGLARHKHDDFEWIARTQVADSFLSVVMGVILGPMAEQYFLTSMVANANYLSVFVTRPVSAVILSLSALMVLWPTLKARRGVGGSGVPATPDPATQRIVD